MYSELKGRIEREWTSQCMHKQLPCQYTTASRLQTAFGANDCSRSSLLCCLLRAPTKLQITVLVGGRWFCIHYPSSGNILYHLQWLSAHGFLYLLQAVPSPCTMPIWSGRDPALPQTSLKPVVYFVMSLMLDCWVQAKQAQLTLYDCNIKVSPIVSEHKDRHVLQQIPPCKGVL